jgi:hypothetical protein
MYHFIKHQFILTQRTQRKHRGHQGQPPLTTDYSLLTIPHFLHERRKIMTETCTTKKVSVVLRLIIEEYGDKGKNTSKGARALYALRCAVGIDG